MAFFYPELYAQIDWSAGYETLDKELQAITTQSMLGKRFVDKLIKVKSLKGTELWVLLHIEVQGEKKPTLKRDCLNTIIAYGIAIIYRLRP